MQQTPPSSKVGRTLLAATSHSVQRDAHMKPAHSCDSSRISFHRQTGAGWPREGRKPRAAALGLRNSSYIQGDTRSMRLVP
jgi:hypothetical protein